MAERAISAYEEHGTGEAEFPAAAERIRRARETLGLTQDAVASRWGEQASMYWDLELFDDEAFTVISVHQLQRLSSVLQTSINRLLFGEEPAPPLRAVRYSDVVAGLTARMIQNAVSVEQLGDDIGWHLESLITDPDTLGDLPVAGLWSVCRAANVDWVAVISTDQSASS